MATAVWENVNTRGRIWAARLSWLYLALAVGAWIVLRHGDDWWPGTLLLYGPRWPLALPLLCLLPAALIWPRRLLFPVVAAAAIVAWPVLGIVVNLPTANAGQRHQQVKVLTLNADGEHLNRLAFETLLATETPDVVVLQETPDRLLEKDAWGSDWRVQAAAPKLLIASKYSMRPAGSLTLWELGGAGGTMACRLETPLGTMHLTNVHLDTPRGGLEPVLHGRDTSELSPNAELRDRGSAAVIAWLADTMGNVIVAGDFNLARESAIYRHYWSHYGDAFGERGLGLGYTKFTRWHGVRIDHVLHGSALKCTDCRVGPDVASDHRPVLAVLESSGPAAKGERE